jgi:predicted N-acyltransferase
MAPTLSLVVPSPLVTVTHAAHSPHWWPDRPADPRRSRQWACGTRQPDDGITFTGLVDGPALWVRPAGAGQAPVRQAPVRHDPVEVCTGAVAGLPHDADLAQQARETYHRHIVASANGYVSPLIADRDVSRPDLLSLIGALVDTAARAGALPAVLNCHADDPLLEPLRASGFMTGITDLYAVLDLPGHGFDDYLAGLPSHQRRNVRRERRQLGSAAARWHIGSEAAGRLDDAATLVAEAYAARGQVRDPVDVGDSYRRLLDAFGDDLVLCVVDVADAPVATACLVRGASELLVYSAGLRPSAARSVAGYFNATYYLPIEFAYAHGIRRLLFGPTSTRAKALRGATFLPMVSAVPRSCEPLATALAATDTLLRAELTRLSGEG